MKCRPNFPNRHGRKRIEAQWLATALNFCVTVSAQTSKAITAKGVAYTTGETVT
jgi:hypothetical protein